MTNFYLENKAIIRNQDYDFFFETHGLISEQRAGIEPGVVLTWLPALDR
jgi:hypothetical protein